MFRRRSVRHLALVLAGVLAVAGLAACGGDDDDDEATGDDTEETTDEAEEGEEEEGEVDVDVDADVQAYCDGVVAIETIPEPDIDFESLSEEELQEEIAAFATDEMIPLTEEIAANTPDEIAEEIEILIGAVEEVAETGDFSVFDTPEVEEASATTHVFDLANCGWASSPVEATDYAFSNVGSTYDAGIVSFDLTNAGEESHEFVLFRKNDGVTQSFDEILALGEEESQELVTNVAGISPIAPGDTDYSVVDLESGDYVALCFLPVGATPEVVEAVESGQQEPPEGPPHFTQGMKVAFTVS